MTIRDVTAQMTGPKEDWDSLENPFNLQEYRVSSKINCVCDCVILVLLIKLLLLLLLLLLF